MEKKEDLKTKVIEKLQSVKSEIEHLEVQLALGKAEAVDKFEEKKAQMKAKVATAKAELETAEGKGKEIADKLKPELEHLQVQLALGKMESLDKYHAFEKEAKSSVHSLSEKAHELMEKGEGKYEEIGKLVKAQVQDFKTQMDVFRLQLALGEAEAKDEYEEKKKVFLKEAKTIGSSVDEALSKAEGKIEEISDKIYHEFKDLKEKFFS